MKFKTGDIVTHKHRKTAYYLIVVNGNEYLLVRVKKQSGYPIVPAGRYREFRDDMLTLVDHHKPYETLTKVEAARHNFRKNAAQNNQLGQEGGLPACTDYAGIPDHYKTAFLQVANSLSPENLTCDGELT